MTEENVNYDEKKKPSLKNIIIIGELLILIVLLIGIFMGLTHRAFNIRYINFKNEGYITKEEIVQLFDKEELNKNIFLFDTGEIKNRINKNFENVIHVNIYKKLPDTLNIEMKESIPIGYIKDGGQIKIIDQGGILHDEDKFRMDTYIPEISYGDGKTLDKEKISFIRDVLTYNFSENIKKINFENDGTIDIMYKDIVVGFESLDDSKKKLDLVEKLINDLNNRNMDVKSIFVNKNNQAIIENEKSGN